MPRVIISAGHSEKDPGTIVNDYREVDITRSIAKSIVPHLRKNGILTLSVPQKLQLKDKIEWINKTGYEKENNDIALEIHINEGDGKKTGIEGWYEKDDKGHSQKLTNQILQTLSKETQLENKGSSDQSTHEIGELAFITKTKPVASLIEIGFMDNKSDLEFITNTKNIVEIGKSIAIAIMKYFNLEYNEVDLPSNFQNTLKVQQNTEDEKKSNDDKSSAQSSRNLLRDKIQKSSDNNSLTTSNNPKSLSNKLRGPSMGNSSFGNRTSNSKSSSSNSYLKSRDERKEMIKDNYNKILGRAPNKSDLNYFLNTGINEEKLIEKMINSQEHADLVRARQEVLTTKAKFHSQEAELILLRSQVEDKTQLIDNLNSLLAQKNVAITELQRRLRYIENQLRNTPNQNDNHQNKKINYNEPFIDKIFRFFSDRLG